MAGRRTKLTPEVHQHIVAFIRAGAYDWVAAEAAGIGTSAYYRWMERGEASAAEPYRRFWSAVRQARAQARVAAEIEVRRDNPVQLAALRPGPRSGRGAGLDGARGGRGRHRGRCLYRTWAATTMRSRERLPTPAWRRGANWWCRFCQISGHSGVAQPR